MRSIARRGCRRWDGLRCGSGRRRCRRLPRWGFCACRTRRRRFCCRAATDAARGGGGCGATCFRNWHCRGRRWRRVLRSHLWAPSGSERRGRRSLCRCCRRSRWSSRGRPRFWSRCGCRRRRHRRRGRRRDDPHRWRRGRPVSRRRDGRGCRCRHWGGGGCWGGGSCRRRRPRGRRIRCRPLPVPRGVAVNDRDTCATAGTNTRARQQLPREAPRLNVCRRRPSRPQLPPSPAGGGLCRTRRHVGLAIPGRKYGRQPPRRRRRAAQPPWVRSGACRPGLAAATVGAGPLGAGPTAAQARQPPPQPPPRRLPPRG